VPAKAARQCGEAVQAIKVTLAQCRVDKPSSVRGAVKGWLKARVKHKRNLEELQATLESATSQLRTSLAIATKYETRGIFI
jgi:hypothetical protein